MPIWLSVNSSDISSKSRGRVKQLSGYSEVLSNFFESFRQPESLEEPLAVVRQLAKFVPCSYPQLITTTICDGEIVTLIPRQGWDIRFDFWNRL